MANKRGKSGSSDRFIFLGSQITADRDCNHEIKKTLLPWMESYDKARDIKSKDITLLTMVCMHGCESWTIKQAERQRIDAFKL